MLGNAKNVNQLRACDSLVVICGKNHTATPELPLRPSRRREVETA
jgi:hypothetical protein